MSVCSYFCGLFADATMGRKLRCNCKDMKSGPNGPGFMLEYSVSFLVYSAYLLSIFFMLLAPPPYL